jgi:hypothetical protein
MSYFGIPIRNGLPVGLGSIIPLLSGGRSAPSLSLDFLSGSLDSRVTFTRASTATYVSSAGLIQSAAIDSPRFDYSPTTLSLLGFLVEESRTNLLTYSAQFDNAAWTKQASVTVTANTTVAPDGTTTGDTVTANQDFAVYQSVTSTIGTTYSQSVFVKAGTATAVMFRDDRGAGRHIVFNPSTGVITSTSGALVTSGSQAFGNGWWRYWFTYVADATLVRGNIRPNSSGSAQTFIVWGAQTEVGTFPTSYIPTTTAAVTRAEDVAAVNTLSPWFNPAEGTLFVQAAEVGISADSYLEVSASFTPSPADAANEITLYGKAATKSSGIMVRTDTAVQFLDFAPNNTTLAGVTYKQAGAYKTNDAAYVRNGVVIASTNTLTVPNSLTKLNLGGQFPYIFITACIWLKLVTYYPVRLTNAQLQALTV